MLCPIAFVHCAQIVQYINCIAVVVVKDKLLGYGSYDVFLNTKLKLYSLYMIGDFDTFGGCILSDMNTQETLAESFTKFNLRTNPATPILWYFD